MNKKELLQKCADLGIDTKGLDTNAKLEAAIEAKEAELAKVEVAAEVVTPSEETVTESTEAVTEKEETVTESAETVTAPEETVKETPGAENAPAETEAEEAEEKEALVYEDDRGRKWTFKATAPETLNIDGHPMTQEEIFNSEAVISELVYGNCSFLTKIN